MGTVRSANRKKKGVDIRNVNTPFYLEQKAFGSSPSNVFTFLKGNNYNYYYILSLADGQQFINKTFRKKKKGRKRIKSQPD